MIRTATWPTRRRFQRVCRSTMSGSVVLFGIRTT
jgi:hypothetical protein